ncbi:phospholipase C, phosphocholine-specific [Streptomyces sp. NBC_01210]|uniref:phosphocholine-specific phospholipase C n=1 Tax=Streptomyces sp. NBC_01210 TaxID=2903774 RepID=UPI002E12C363|nr:phospholipase C, phosphocholine-specific [Streptomyces sp. NBC_01210]
MKKNSVGRRTFLTSAAAVAAGAAVASGLPPGLRGSRGLALAPAAALVNAPDPLLQEKVKHVVVLMQENHSFDDYFGMLKGVRGFGDRSVIDMPGTTGTSGQPSGRTVFQQPDVPADEDNVANPAGWRYPWPLNGGGSQGWEQAQNVGTDHGWGSGHMAWNNGKMDQWIKAKDQIGMGYLLPADLPFHYALADAYTVCDAYHCSVMGRTGPNRNYAWSGSTGEGMDGWTLQHLYAGSFMPEPEEKGDDAVPQTWVPYAQALQDAGVDWKTYHVRGDNFCDNALEYFKVFQDTEQYRDSTGSAHAREREMWQRGMGPTRAEIDDADEDAPGTADMIIAELTQDIAAGALPTVSWIVADEDHSEAAGNTPSKGAVFVKQVVEALAADEDVYNSTVLIINFDENDGFYDHVPPPVPDPDSDYAENEWLTDDDHNFVPIGLGFRVPMIVVSPWTRGGWVNSQVFDHTSVLRFLEKLTGVQCDNISAWRRKVCGDLTSIFDFDNPNPNTPTLPSPAPPGKTPGANANPSVDPIAPANSGSLPVQQTGVRPARALPYQANAYLDRYTGTGPAADQKAWINYENLGDPATSAVHFATYVNAYRGGGPWQYTIDANDTADDYFNIGNGLGNGKYDFTVIGPNRFLRRFKGNTSTANGRHARVTSRFAEAYDPIALWFDFHNDHPTATVTFTVTSNHYRTGSWTTSVGPASTGSDYFNQFASGANGWYDFTVTVSNDSNWSQRFIGHIETGDPSITGSGN